MKQILQDLNTGETILEDIPCPRNSSGNLLIKTNISLVSAGTERMLVDFGKANVIDKARQQPDKVRMVLDKIKTDGLVPTVKAVRNKLDQALPLGYCNVGTVMEVGSSVDTFSLGDRVASNGKHAEVVSVPKNLCVKIPDGVTDEEASFTVIGAIALQGIRLAQPTLGEVFVVTGLGLIGLVAVQLLRAHGCKVLGIDFDPKKLKLARELGAETVDLSAGQDPIAAAEAFSRGRGVDGVIITASTKSNEPVHQAAVMCRKRGRIILVGVVGLELSRADFFEKELTFQVSCSYGPGRYDALYEEEGQDYPVGFVRWTEQRNFEAILDMLAEGRLNVKLLISHHFDLDKVDDAYKLVGGEGESLGIVLQYPTNEAGHEESIRQRVIKYSNSVAKSGKAIVGFIGSGNYATGVLIPAFSKTDATLKSVASSAGISGVHVAKKFGFAESTTDTEALIADPSINTVVITTRHNSHAGFVCGALRAGKNVFVEKPLTLTRDELGEVASVYNNVITDGQGPLLMVGFNRRFSPQVVKMKSLLSTVNQPMSFVMTINAGQIPADHWTQDHRVGGGRIIGEACHFIDLLRFLADSPISGIQAAMIGKTPGEPIQDDKVTFTLSFENGSLGTVHYLANGHKSFPKERLDVFCAGRILQLDNYRAMKGYGWPDFKKMNLFRQDKGNTACAAAFVNAITEGKPSPIPFEELVEVTNVSFDIVDLIKNNS